MTTTETTQEKKVMIEVSVKLRIATAEDFRIEETYEASKGVLKTKFKPNLGKSYWLKSQLTGKVDNKCYQINEDTFWPEFRSWLSQGMIWVSVSDIRLDDYELQPNKQQLAS